MGQPSSEIIFLSLIFLSIDEWRGRPGRLCDRWIRRELTVWIRFAHFALFRGHPALLLLVFRENQVGIVTI